MNLFLASHNFGDHVEKLQAMVGDNRKVLIVPNARDHHDETKRKQALAEKLALFQQNGFEPEMVDLREYFAKMPDQLEDFVDKLNPGLIYCLGGDVFLLATALAVSGMDEIIRRRVKANLSVYGGSSAGSMIAAQDIEIYERDDLRVEEVEAYYGIEAITAGLGLIDEYIIPHADNSKYDKNTELYREQIAKAGYGSISLNDTDVYVVEGDRHTILRNNGK